MARRPRTTGGARKTGTKSKPLGLLERLAQGPVICAEGYLFEFERRGYLQAGAYVPEIVLDRPDLVESLHREFVHAGSDVVEAFTYYAHRAKLRMVGREEDLAKINRTALRIAKKVARSTGTLLAGDICNTSIYDPGEPKSHKQVRRIFDEQIEWAVEAGVDFIVAETYSFGGEALLALEAIRRSGRPAVVTLAIPRDGTTREGWNVADACRRLEAGGAAVVGLNCARGPATTMPLLREIRAAVTCHVAALPVPYRTTAAEPIFQRLSDPSPSRKPRLPDRARSVPLQPLRDRRVRQGGACARRPLPRRLLRRGTASHPEPRRGARPPAAREPVLAGHVQAHPVRHRQAPVAENLEYGRQTYGAAGSAST